MTLPLEGRRALVGGSSRGIGYGCAVALANAGAQVTVTGRHADSLEEARASLPASSGQEHGSIAVDFADGDALRDAVESDLSAHGPIVILVNNTGGPPAGPAHEADPEAFTAAFELHVLGNQALVQTLLPGMMNAAYGRIINIISSSVVTPIPNLGVSNTVRGAVAQWAKTLAAELAPHGITVNSILPGSIDTPRLRDLMRSRATASGQTLERVEEEALASIPAGRLGKPSDIGSVAAFLASPAAEYVTGVNLPVDGGRLSVQ